MLMNYILDAQNVDGPMEWSERSGGVCQNSRGQNNVREKN